MSYKIEQQEKIGVVTLKGNEKPSIKFFNKDEYNDAKFYFDKIAYTYSYLNAHVKGYTFIGNRMIGNRPKDVELEDAFVDKRYRDINIKFIDCAYDINGLKLEKYYVGMFVKDEDYDKYNQLREIKRNKSFQRYRR